MKKYLVAMVMVLLFSGIAFAQENDRKFGGCFGKTCFGPSAAVFVGQVNLKTGDFSGGLIPGAGYGVTFFTEKWHQVGVDVFAAMDLGGEAKNIQVAGVLSFAEYIRAGFGAYCEEHERAQPLFIFGIGANFGK